MAEITIRFRHNRVTGRRELVIHLESDSDIMQHEHEGDHRRLVENLIGQKLSDDTDVIVQRVEKTSTPTELAEPAAPLPVRQPVSEQG
jgi:hypothetical protein